MIIRIGRESESHNAMLRSGSSSWLLCVSLEVGPVFMTAETARAICVHFDRTTPDEDAALARHGFVLK
jgi:hypothetical protein